MTLDRFASAGLVCRTESDARAKSEQLALEAKLGKPVFRKKEVAITSYFAMPRGFEIYGIAKADDYKVGLSYDFDATKRQVVSNLSEFANAGVSHFFGRSATPGELRLNFLTHRTTLDLNSQSGSVRERLKPKDFYFTIYLDASPRLPEEAEQYIPNLPPLSEFTSKDLKAEFRKSKSTKDFSDRLETYEGLDSLSFEGSYSLLVSNCKSFFKQLAKRKDLESAWIYVSTPHSCAEDTASKCEARLGLPNDMSCYRIHPEGIWDPFERPAEADKAPVRIDLYRRDATPGKVLQIIHRPKGKPVLDLQLTDDSQKPAATKKLEKLVSTLKVPLKLWTKDPWHRWE